jgi:Ankyrin repeat
VRASDVSFGQVVLLFPATQDGDTPLFLASHFGHLEVVNALLGAGADKEAKNKVTAMPVPMCPLSSTSLRRMEGEALRPKVFWVESVTWYLPSWCLCTAHCPLLHVCICKCSPTTVFPFPLLACRWVARRCLKPA